MGENVKNSELQAEVPIKFLWSNPQSQQYFVDAASVASLIGVILSLLALWQVWGLKKKFLKKQRLPNFVTSLEKEVSIFGKKLIDWQEANDASVETIRHKSETEASFRKVVGLLESILDKGCGTPTKNEIEGFLTMYNLSDRKKRILFFTQEQIVITLLLCWEIHPKLPVLLQKVKGVVEDMQSEVS